MRLAIRSRSTGIAAADVDRSLIDGALVVTWLNRGTLHLVAADDLWWLHPLTAPQHRVRSQRRLEQEGVDHQQAERGTEIIIDAVRTDGPLTRSQLRARLDDVGIPTAGQALVHLIGSASLDGAIVRGPVVEGGQAFVSSERWIGGRRSEFDLDEALARLARRYLVAHGPASPVDLAKWAGITLGRARRGFDAITDEVEPAEDGLVLCEAPAIERCEMPPPLLLGGFDELLLGWASRGPFVGEHQVVTTNGIIHPVALVDGRVAATWGLAGGTVTIRPLESISTDDRDALAADGADVLTYLGLPPTAAAFGERGDDTDARQARSVQ